MPSNQTLSNPSPLLAGSLSTRRHLTLLAVILPLLLNGCGWFDQDTGVVRDRSTDYKTSSSLPPLEVPPDLSSSNIDEAMRVPVGEETTYSEYAAGKAKARPARKSAVLPTNPDITIARAGDKRWLVMQGPPSVYWPRVRDFWLDSGFLLKIDNPAIGIMETDWAENRADLPQGWIRGFLGKIGDAIYSAATRDKFRVRLERGVDSATTELYLTHRGVEEVASEGRADDSEVFVWEPRPADPELEAEMLNRLMVFLGVAEEKATRLVVASRDRQDRSTIQRDASGNIALSLREGFSRAWRRTGLALDRVGFTVEDRDRTRGLYFVRYVDPLKDTRTEDGWLSNLAFWKSDKVPENVEYLVSLVAEGNLTQMIILDKDGARDNSDTAGRILNLLHEQLK